MTREQAVKRLKQMYKKPYFRVGERVSSPEQREAVRADHARVKADLAQLDAEYNAWLAQQPEHQQWKQQRAVMVRQKNQLDVMPYYKFQIGHDDVWARVISGEGDTWEEAFAQAEKSKA